MSTCPSPSTSTRSKSAAASTQVASSSCELAGTAASACATTLRNRLSMWLTSAGCSSGKRSRHRSRSASSDSMAPGQDQVGAELPNRGVNSIAIVRGFARINVWFLCDPLPRWPPGGHRAVQAAQSATVCSQPPPRGVPLLLRAPETVCGRCASMRIIIVRACLSVQRQGAAGVPASAGQHACPPPSCCRAGASRQASHLRSGWRTLPATPPLPLSRARAAKAEYGSPCEKQRSNPPRWRLSAVQRQVPDEHLSLDTVDLQQVEDEMFSSDDSASASDAGEQPWLQEQAQVMQALRLVKGEDMSAARDMAEATLNANPANAPALFVNAAECETRQVL